MTTQVVKTNRGTFNIVVFEYRVSRAVYKSPTQGFYHLQQIANLCYLKREKKLLKY